jgi:hypothetical protein
MQLVKILEDLTSNQDEYNELYNTDHLFVIKGKDLDDHGLIDVINDIDHHEWFRKLRGMGFGPAKLHNIHNNKDWVHGYIIAVSNQNLTNFEKLAVLVGMKHGYTFSKIDIFQSKKEKVDTHFDSLFEVIQ